MGNQSIRRVLLTGATGFVGGRLYPELVRAGYAVRCLTRNADRARRKRPDYAWVEGDVADRSAMRRALEGCDAAYYLVHGMAEGEADFRKQEVEAAECFAEAAGSAGVRRLVYLGGMVPDGPPSAHLLSRLEVGDALRRGPVLTVELRASMIIGHGSLSWLIVRDLASRLPVMVLPRWLRSSTQPVAIDDVLVALVRALELPLERSEAFDIPGPETIPAREILERIAALLGLRPAMMIEVPVLTPWLSSKWVRFVTRAEWSVAREVVVGLNHDLLARDDHYWERIDHPRRLSFEEAARRALAAEHQEGPVLGAWGSIERWLSRHNRVRARA